MTEIQPRFRLHGISCALKNKIPQQKLALEGVYTCRKSTLECLNELSAIYNFRLAFYESWMVKINPHSDIYILTI